MRQKMRPNRKPVTQTNSAEQSGSESRNGYQTAGRFALLKRRFVGHTWRWWFVTVGTPLSFILCLFFLLRSIPDDFVAKLAPDGVIHVEYGDTYLDKKSPACGCYMADAHEWRGITFISQALRLGPVANKDNAQASAYLLTSAFPGLVTPYPGGWFKIKATVYVIRLRNEQDFYEPALVEGILRTDTYEVISRQAIPTGSSITLVSDSAVNFRTMGDVPIGAWIPRKSSELSIGLCENNADDCDYQLVEAPLKSVTSANVPETGSEAADSAYPILDYLGPKLVVWTKSPIQVFGSQGFYWEGNDEGLVNALVIDVPFALRTTIGTLNRVSPDVARDFMSHTDTVGMMIDAPGQGEISAQLVKSQSEIPINHERLTAKLRDEGTTLVRSKLLGEIGDSMMFRFPLVPDTQGLNLFGQIERLRFESASGTVMVGARHIPLGVSVPVEMQNASSFENPNGDIFIPVQIGKDAIKLNREYSARASLVINGEQISRQIDKRQIFIDAVSALLTILVVAGWLWRRLTS